LNEDKPILGLLTVGHAWETWHWSHTHSQFALQHAPESALQQCSLSRAHSPIVMHTVRGWPMNKVQ